MRPVTSTVATGSCRSSSSLAWPLALALVAGACSSKDVDDGEPVEPAPKIEPQVSPPRAPAPEKPLPAYQGEHQGKVVWARSIGGPSQDESRAVDIDAKGNVAVAGRFVGKVDLGAGVVVEAAGIQLGFVGLLDPAGKPRWMQPLRSGAEVSVSDVTFDAKGNVIVVGWFSGTLDVGGLQTKAAGADDGYIAVLDPAGKPLWVRALGGDNADILYGVDVDPQGGLVVIGEKRGAADFGGGELPAKGSADIFVVRLSPDGTHLWSQAWGDMAEDNGRAIAFDGRGDVVLAAEMGMPLDFGDGKQLAHKGKGDVAVVKLDSAGRLVWARSFGNTFDDVVLGLAVDGADNIVLCGSFEDKLKVAGAKLVAGERMDAYVVKMNAAGDFVWAKSYGADGEDKAVACAADRFGNVVVTGWFEEKVSFGGAALEAPNHNQDGFLLKLSPAGAHLWSRRFGDRDYDRGRAVAVDAEGNIALAGIYRFSLDLDGATLESIHPAGAKVADADAFFARFGP